MMLAMAAGCMIEREKGIYAFDGCICAVHSVSEMGTQNVIRMGAGKGAQSHNGSPVTMMSPCMSSMALCSFLNK
jgi:hypothetical protein